MKERDEMRKNELVKALQGEIDKRALQELEIKEIFKQREEQQSNDLQTNNCIQSIQFVFETWFRNIGQFQKKAKKKRNK